MSKTTNPAASHSVRILSDNGFYRVTIHAPGASTNTRYYGLNKRTAWQTAKALQGYQIMFQDESGTRRKIA